MSVPSGRVSLQNPLDKLVMLDFVLLELSRILLADQLHHRVFSRNFFHIIQYFNKLRPYRFFSSVSIEKSRNGSNSAAINSPKSPGNSFSAEVPYTSVHLF